MTTEYIGCDSVTKVSYNYTEYCMCHYLVVSLIVIVKDYHLYFKSLFHLLTSCIVVSDYE